MKIKYDTNKYFVQSSRLSNLSLKQILIGLISLPLFSACPDEQESSPEPVEPQITISSALPCIEPILPVYQSSIDETPTVGTIEVVVTGISASESNGLNVKLYYEDQRIVGCFLSSSNGDTGAMNYRCNTLESSELSLSARRAYDSLYCLNRGKMKIYAEITLPNGDYKQSDPLEIICIERNPFESSCTPVGVATADMGLDMELSDMEVDMSPEEPEPIEIPTQWSIGYTSLESPTQLSVQGSTNEAPHVGRYTFKVVDQDNQPLSEVPVRFFLNWSALDEYPLCDISCSQEQNEEACSARDACLWDLTLSRPVTPEEEQEGGSVGGIMSGTQAGAQAGAQAGEVSEEGGNTSERMAPRMFGRCRMIDEWEGDERCARIQDRCEANFCLPTRNPGAVGPLPVAIDPYYKLTDRNGNVTVSMSAQDEPGVFSIRAEASIADRTQIANTPNINVIHEIATQASLSLSCAPSVVNSFSTHDAPNELNPNGYQLYQFDDPISSCSLLVGDRFSGPIRGSSVFFLSESGTITQSSVTDENGRAIGQLMNSAPTPADVDPKSYTSPYIDYSGDRLCQPNESLTGTCNDIEERQTSIYWQFGANGNPRSMVLNPRDGLSKVVAFTQGEALFIDYIREGNDPLASVVGLYQPEYDFVPLHSEPFIDSNDNQRWDIGERFFDVNRNGSWDLDVFGREDRADELRCAHSNLLALAAASEGGQSPAFINCTNDLHNLILDLTVDNPNTLNAYIWTSTQILNVGLPNITTSENLIDITCFNSSTCIKALAYNNNFPCGALPGGAQIALNTTESNAYVQVKLSLTDAHLNCIGITDVSYRVDGDQISESAVIIEDPLHETALPWGGYQPNYNDCFSPILNGVPIARSMVVAGVANHNPPANPDSPFSYKWIPGEISINVQVPDHRITLGGSLNNYFMIPAAICVQE